MAGQLNIFTEATQKQILDELKIQNAQLEVIANGWNVKDWKAVQKIVQAGAAERYFPLGTQFNVPHTEYGNIIFDVVGHDHHKKVDDPDAHTMTLLMHDVIYDKQFDAQELLWANTTDSAIPAGAYTFTLYKGGNGGRTEEDGTYQFVIEQPIPVGGGWTHSAVGLWYANTSSYTPANITNGVVTTYDADRSVLENNVAVIAASGGTNLGTASNAKADCINAIGAFNSVMRRAYGNNSWRESAVRQWLNGNAVNGWWQKQNAFDMPPTYKNAKGFLSEIDNAFENVLSETKNATAQNTVYENGDISVSVETQDKVFLISMTEAGLGNNNKTAEGSALPFYEGATQTDRVKYDRAAPTTARNWWFRSPHPRSTASITCENTDGAMSAALAIYGFGAAAACVIG